jgi:hypothetical protein
MAEPPDVVIEPLVVGWHPSLLSPPVPLTPVDDEVRAARIREAIRLSKLRTVLDPNP